jgi:hypothetical protein
MKLVVWVLKHGHENVTILSQSIVEETAIIKESLLSTDHVQKSLVLVSQLFLVKNSQFQETFNFPRYFLLLSLVNGGYSNWTLSEPCSVSCGDDVEIWRRFCNNSEPKYGGRNCSGLGISTEFRNCSRKPCPSKAKTST